MMLNQEAFFTKYNIRTADFEATGIKWDELIAIHNDYLNFREELEPTAILLFNKLMKAPNVHSVRYRIKDSEHLIEKIIRKKISDSDSNITLENYKETLTDLIGLRALHLFKDDWENINDFIVNAWNQNKPPVANFRKGDSDQITKFFEQKGCTTKEHQFGYRSIHYIIETQPGKQKYYAEIQVRTIFEEAWAEIDHTIRYPYDLENPIFSQFLLILNRLSGSADEMGSFIQLLKRQLILKEAEFKTQLEEKNSLINDLEANLDKLNIKSEEFEKVKADLNKLKQQKNQQIIFNDPFSNITSRRIAELGYYHSLMSDNIVPNIDPINRSIINGSLIHDNTRIPNSSFINNPIHSDRIIINNNRITPDGSFIINHNFNSENILKTVIPPNTEPLKD